MGRNPGGGAVCSTPISEAAGKFILCLDGDDMILPTLLEKCLRLRERNEDIAIAYTDR